MYAALSALPTHLKCHVFEINKNIYVYFKHRSGGFNDIQQ